MDKDYNILDGNGSGGAYDVDFDDELQKEFGDLRARPAARQKGST